MAKKKEKPKQTPWTGSFKNMNAKMTDLNRAERQEEKRRVAKIPSCTIFMNGQRVVLNGN